MILLIDNYDSFVFNLARYIERLGISTTVVRNDAIGVDEIAGLSPSAIVISPGPCTPKEAGISVDCIRRFTGSIPLLGICLGHQAIAEAFGGTVSRSARPIHGRASEIQHDGQTLFERVPNPFQAGRYHSLIVEPSSLPSCLEVTARTDDGVIMGIRHAIHPVHGLQFHPESILTEHGYQLLKNFMAIAGVPTRDFESKELMIQSSDKSAFDFHPSYSPEATMALASRHKTP